MHILYVVLFMLVVTFANSGESPSYNIYDGPALAGVFRSTILGASLAFADIPIGATASINGFDISFKAGDRITVDDATMFYIYDGSHWRPICVISITNIFHAPNISTPGIIAASAALIPKTEWSFLGNNSYDIITLPTPAIDGTLELDAITSPHISHAIEWTDGNQWASIKNPPLAGQSYYSIAGASPIVKWFPRTTYRFRFYEVTP